VKVANIAQPNLAGVAEQREYVAERDARSKSRPSPPEALNSGSLEGTIGYSVLELMNAYHRLVNRQTHSVLGSLNTTQWRTLTCIRFNPDQTQQAIARHVRISPASMTPIIDLLERKGWVRRHPSAVNRSAYGLRMTTSGLKAFRTQELVVIRSEALCAEILGAPGRAELASLMLRLRDGLNEACAMPARKRGG
jgi:DNA-binding MarR family transcriptional regulator